MSSAPPGPQLEVTWDPHKEQSNLGKHGVEFVHAATVLLDPLAVTVFDAAHSQTEERWFTLGLSSTGQLPAGVAHLQHHRAEQRQGQDHFGAPSHPGRTPAVRG